MEITDSATGLAIDFANHPFLNYNSATRTLIARSFSVLDADVTLNLSQKLVDYPDVAAHVSQVQITVVDACPSTTLDTFSDFSLTTGELLSPVPSLTLANVQDEQSRLLGNVDGVTTCGPRVYTILADGTWPASVTITQSGPDGRTFTAFSSVVGDALNSPYTVQVEVSLLNYPLVPPQTATATLTVLRCAVTAVTPITSLTSFGLATYKIFDPAQVIPFDYD